jgi:hypothetical protein
LGFDWHKFRSSLDEGKDAEKPNVKVGNPRKKTSKNEESARLPSGEVG